MTEQGFTQFAYRNGRLNGDYRGAHVVMPDGRLAEIVAVEYVEYPTAGYRATLRHFNHEPVIGSWPLFTLKLLDRTWEPTP